MSGVCQGYGSSKMLEEQWPPKKISLAEGKRVLFLTKDLDLISKQLYSGLNLKMEDLSIDDLLDDINTDVMTPAWVCFDHEPSKIAENAYAGLMHGGRRVFEERALIDGNFEVDIGTLSVCPIICIGPLASAKTTIILFNAFFTALVNCALPDTKTVSPGMLMKILLSLMATIQFFVLISFLSLTLSIFNNFVCWTRSR